MKHGEIQRAIEKGINVPNKTDFISREAAMPEWCGGKIETMEQLRKVVAV